MSSFSYDRAQVIKWLGSRTVDKARTYVREVSDMHWHNNVLSANVQGTQRRPYQVDVVFHDKHGVLSVQGQCSCPVGYGCKHAAAVLLANVAAQAASASTSGKPAFDADTDEEEDSDDAPSSSEGRVRPELVGWLEGFRSRFASRQPTSAKKPPGPNAALALAYVLTTPKGYRRTEVEIFKVRPLADKSVRLFDQRWNNVDAALVKQPKFVSDADMTILRGLWLDRSRNGIGGYSLRGENGAELLQRMLATGRLFASPLLLAEPVDAHRPLHEGASRTGRIEWEAELDDRLRPILRTEPAATLVIATEPFWYADADSGEAGIIEISQTARQLADYLSMPPISLEEAPLVSALLREIELDLPLPPELATQAIQVIDTEPVPVLALDSLHLPHGFGPYDARPGVLDFATVRFDYDGISVDAERATTLMRAASGEMIQVKRRVETEQAHLLLLHKLGLEKIARHYRFGPQPVPSSALGLPTPDAWRAFVGDALPALRKNGWRVTMTSAFRFDVIEIDAIEANARQTDGGWFDLELGVTIGERTVRLEPLLEDLFKRDRRWLGGAFDSIEDDESVEFMTDRGERLRLRADRIKPFVRVMIDLFDTMGGDGTLRISAADTGRLEALSDTGRWQFHGDASIRTLAQRLRDGPSMREVAVPVGLHAELRGYQREGLNWMQFLRESDLSGILADDMGLGKTVQTLAHILAEKEAGRLDRPALIVVPTTLVHNWREEAQRFAPGLRVLDLHGPQRRERFDQIGSHDLVLTTYPLLWRDQAVLAEHEYHLLILDEAQIVKNVATKAAKGIRDLRARHRLCLTGTPLENHLGELWAQFDFLLPGFLGSQKDFTKRWRTPIEKYDDTVRRDLLVRRIRPFMLRRRKDEVAKELPPKTTIVQTVALEGAQRDLYETVRTAMQEKVRTAVAAQGLARSHIVVLEALLKLRQVCCDPGLVKLPGAGKVKESAKLDLLLEMLPELLEEGRRVLLFSQFTGMLAIIAAALDRAGLPYVLLTGDTTDRVTPVRRFQQGEVPLFLISLKAGGVGLNLTAADTVIHYDPWWNPAAENQATDRAHRLGQDKPVFVYKLIAAGSIEEKIVDMQGRKAALADSILREDSKGAAKFSADDIEALFAPMPGVGSGR
jgi:superfamily II DNA or RNA helicase